MVHPRCDENIVDIDTEVPTGCFSILFSPTTCKNSNQPVCILSRQSAQDMATCPECGVPRYGDAIWDVDTEVATG